MSDNVEQNIKREFPSLTVPNGLGTGPVPIEPYISEEWYQLEQKRVFGRAWLCMGRVEQLPEADTYFVKDVEVCDAFVLVTRDKQDRIRAFHNVCSHRANMLVLERQGKGSRFVCNYHRWTYRNNGDCMGVPDKESFFDLDLDKCGLTSIACEVWEGWVFINLQTKPEVSLEEFLGEFGRSFKGLPAPSADNASIISATQDANWKITADAFAESYHVPCLHTNTLGTTFSNKSNPFSKPLHARNLGSHRTMTTFGNPDYQIPDGAAVEKLAYAGIDSGNVLGAADKSDVEVILNHPSVNPSKASDWATEIGWLFPNYIIFYSPGGFFTMEFWPTSRRTTRWEARLFAPKATTFKQRLQQEHHISRFTEIFLEDVGNLDRQQLAMESRAKSHMILQDAEFMLRHNHEAIKRWVEAENVRDALTD